MTLLPVASLIELTCISVSFRQCLTAVAPTAKHPIAPADSKFRASLPNVTVREADIRRSPLSKFEPLFCNINIGLIKGTGGKLMRLLLGTFYDSAEA